MILTFQHFQALWRRFFEDHLNNQDINTLYQNYIIRENYLEDYIDIFRGQDTRVERQQVVNGAHRFQNLFQLLYEIKYLLIAEAAPHGTNYIFQNAKGAYITAPLNAFNTPNVNDLNTEQRLSALASHGVLILDLFPVNLPFNSNGGFLRRILLDNGTTASFFLDQNNHYSIINRVSYMVNNIPNCKFNPVINSAFMATPSINNNLCGNYLNIQPNHLIFQSGLNQIVDGNLQNNYGNQYNIEGLARVPNYIADCCCGSGSPHASLIRSALNL